jgi:hypothetical protein
MLIQTGNSPVISSLSRSKASGPSAEFPAADSDSVTLSPLRDAMEIKDFNPNYVSPTMIGVSAGIIAGAATTIGLMSNGVGGTIASAVGLGAAGYMAGGITGAVVGLAGGNQKVPQRFAIIGGVAGAATGALVGSLTNLGPVGAGLLGLGAAAVVGWGAKAFSE